MDAHSSYHLLNSLYLTLQSLPLLLTPRLIITLLQPEVRDSTSTETFLSRAFALALLALALFSLLLSGVVPLQTGATSTSAAAGETSPYATPVLLLGVAYHVSALILAYLRFNNTGLFAYGAGVAGSGLLAAIGVWCLVFGTGKTHGSSFIFPDAEKRARKVERREEKWARKGL